MIDLFKEFIVYYYYLLQLIYQLVIQPVDKEELSICRFYVPINVYMASSYPHQSQSSIYSIAAG